MLGVAAGAEQRLECCPPGSRASAGAIREGSGGGKVTVCCSNEAEMLSTRPDTDERSGPLITEAEMAVMWPQAKEGGRHQEPEEATDSPEPWRQRSPADTLIAARGCRFGTSGPCVQQPQQLPQWPTESGTPK